ncbi:MAG: DUF1223 domain-containing protein [Myxococcales bacterium]|nr:DUF1223 domain-containing protein [Myxococcales bacterium]
MRVATRLMVGLGLGALAIGAVHALGEPERASADGPRVPVVVELFTSEGCSSCPPADAELARLEREQPVGGATVVPLSLHVDYWNDLGWADPHSDARYTLRQREYVRALGSRTYTPQAVVDGQDELVGSSRVGLDRSIAEAARRPHAEVELKLGARAAAVDVAIGRLPPGSTDAEIVAFWVEPHTKSAVRRGENSGRTLEHTAVVRGITAVGRVDPAGARATVPLQGRPGQATRLVVIVQERARRRIVGAAAIAVP